MSPPSRRAFLHSGAGVAALAATPTEGLSVALLRALTVYTQNLGLGTRLSRLVDLRSGTVDPESRMTTTVDGEEVGRGVSDHAGVVADLVVTGGGDLFTALRSLLG